MPRKLLIVQVAGLGYDFATEHAIRVASQPFLPMETVFPALTCTVQASFRTATAPSAHGMVANGRYHRDLHRTLFWEQSADLVQGPRIWDNLRQRGRKVAMLFWQQSLGESADILLSPAPVHKHHGGMIEDCYGKPAGLYARLCASLRRPFRLARYWGPFASPASSAWIAEATAAVLRDPELAPDLCLTYLPALDYDLQRHGPSHPAARQAVAALRAQLELLESAALAAGYDLLVFGDYAIAPTPDGAVFPNRALHEAGFLAVRNLHGMLYPDFHESRAFALCDHEIAHIYVRQAQDRPAVQRLLSALPGMEQVSPPGTPPAIHLDHPHAGDFIALAAPGRWLAYPWWQHRAEAPDFAGHVDIHNKPGYDPCELFFGWPPGTVSRDAARVRGSHGRVGPSRRACRAGTLPLDGADTLIDIAAAAGKWLDNA
jgi:predicted AlkP superfamily pyrophosphatase or phosphodiesterase